MPDEEETPIQPEIPEESQEEAAKRIEAERANTPPVSPGSAPGQPPDSQVNAVDAFGNEFNPEWHLVYGKKRPNPGEPVRTKSNGRLMFLPGVRAKMLEKYPDGKAPAPGSEAPVDQVDQVDEPSRPHVPFVDFEIVEEAPPAVDQAKSEGDPFVPPQTIEELDSRAESTGELLKDLWHFAGRCVGGKEGKFEGEEGNKLFSTGKRHALDGGNPLPIKAWFQHCQEGFKYMARVVSSDTAGERWGGKGQLAALKKQWQSIWNADKPKKGK